ncbi:MAG: hypothetical protein IJP92_07670 [Lachnospiraceae bacterium]|nr:hypothetical protein [Lachnospiraceae bacterium]
MQYLVFIGIVVFVLLVTALLGLRNAREQKRAFYAHMRALQGKAPDKKYTQDSFRHIPTLFFKHRRDDSVDDITWHDLDMNGVFMRVNYCRSAAGEEMLYHCLRNPASMGDGLFKDAAHAERQISFFAEEADARLAAQEQFEQMRQSTKHSVYDYLDMMDTKTVRNNTPHYLVLFLMAVSIALLFVRFEIFIVVLVLLLVYNLLSYYRIKSEVEPYFATFSHVLRLIDGCRTLSRLFLQPAYRGLFDEEAKAMEEQVNAMASFRRGAFLVMSSGGGSGNPLELLFDYLKIFTHIDLIRFNQMYRELQSHADNVDRLIMKSGALEVLISVACLRSSLADAFCIPQFAEGEAGTLLMEEGYHPLIRGAVRNSIRCDKNVLITGSNASGKSTFLKMTAINAVLAQSLHTVCAKAYEAPLFRIYSSMALTDNLQEGDSYYIVEIKSLKRILDAAQTKGARVLCFVDEVLRGTNTVERIAASAQILKHFASRNVLCFAATHDGELTAMLGSLYDNYHFDGEITEDDVRFDYRLREGSAVTRNAIRLLRILGYDDSIVASAEDSAQEFLQSGVWKAV